MAWKYGDKGDVPAWWDRNRKIEALEPIARFAAGKWARGMAGHSMTHGDIWGAAMVGIIEAVDTYDPSRGVLVGYAKLLAHRAVCDETERYNLTSRWRRDRGRFIRWEPLDLESDSEDDDYSADRRATSADPNADTEGDVLAGADAQEAWNDWAQALTPLERRVCEAAIEHAGECAMAPYSTLFGGLAVVTGLPGKCADNAITKARGRLRRIAEGQGLDWRTASWQELLALRVPDDFPRPQGWTNAHDPWKFRGETTEHRRQRERREAKAAQNFSGDE